MRGYETWPLIGWWPECGTAIRLGLYICPVAMWHTLDCHTALRLGLYSGLVEHICLEWEKAAETPAGCQVCPASPSPWQPMQAVCFLFGSEFLEIACLTH